MLVEVIVDTNIIGKHLIQQGRTFEVISDVYNYQSIKTTEIGLCVRIKDISDNHERVLFQQLGMTGKLLWYKGDKAKQYYKLGEPALLNEVKILVKKLEIYTPIYGTWFINK